MLEKVDAEQFKASCKRCMRSSPVLVGDKQHADRSLLAMGWAQKKDFEWSCPVCECRSSGTWNKRED